MNNIKLEFESPDYRPVFILEDVKGASFSDIQAEPAEGMPVFQLKDVTNFDLHRVNQLDDQRLNEVKKLKL
jgi:hypothetical protein